MLALRKEMPAPPNDAKATLEMLAEVLKRKGDLELCMKIAELQGKFAVSQDAAILETIVIELGVMIRELLEPSPSVMIPHGVSRGGLFDEHRPNVIYFCHANGDNGTSMKDLVEGFATYLRHAPERGEKGYSENVINNYKAHIRKVFDKEGIDKDCVDPAALADYLRSIWSELANRRERYGTGAKNVKSAVSVFLVYLDTVLR